MSLELDIMTCLEYLRPDRRRVGRKSTGCRLILAFLKQSGVQATHLQLAEAGVRGDGHMFFLETNSDDIAAEVLIWTDGLNQESEGGMLNSGVSKRLMFSLTRFSVHGLQVLYLAELLRLRTVLTCRLSTSLDHVLSCG